MEYKTVGAKLTREEFARYKNHCEKLDESISAHTRELILDDMQQPTTRFVAGFNIFNYNPSSDKFDWIIETDDGTQHTVLEGISIDFMLNLKKGIDDSFDQRASFIGKSDENSAAIPKNLVGDDGEN